MHEDEQKQTIIVDLIWLFESISGYLQPYSTENKDKEECRK